MMFGIVDVNGFYASCEMVFRPEIQVKYLIIILNNDLSGEGR